MSRSHHAGIFHAHARVMAAIMDGRLAGTEYFSEPAMVGIDGSQCRIVPKAGSTIVGRSPASNPHRLEPLHQSADCSAQRVCACRESARCSFERRMLVLAAVMTGGAAIYAPPKTPILRSWPTGLTPCIAPSRCRRKFRPRLVTGFNPHHRATHWPPWYPEWYPAAPTNRLLTIFMA